MRLELRVTKYKQSPAEVPLVGALDECDGTIGRAKGNDLVLPDPSRYVSSHHATIEYRNGAYSILDTSANGICINDPSRKIGQGISLHLNHGDRLFIGDYEVQISLHDAPALQPNDASVEEMAAGPHHRGARGPTATELIASLGDVPSPAADARDPIASADEFSEGSISGSLPGQDADGRSGVQASDSLRTTGAVASDQDSASDHVPITQQAFTAGNAIPDNWDNADIETVPGAEPTAGRIPEDWDEPQYEGEYQAPNAAPDLEPAPEQPSKQAPQRKQPAAAARSSPPNSTKPANSPVLATSAAAMATQTESPQEQVDRTALDLLLKGLGYSHLDIPDAAVPLVLELAGKLLRESIDGTMHALRARASIRQEMRMELTTIRPRENNPLKFSPTIDEALTHLLAPRTPGYLPPVESIREAFEDLKIHQVATMAGMEAAVKLILTRFDPSMLEQRIQKNNVLDTMLPMKRKARMWELFTELYGEIAKEAEVDFSAVFGQSFIRAYDRHVQQLQVAKKSSKPPR